MAASNNSQNNHKLASRIQAALATVQAWDADPLLLAECRALIPWNELVPAAPHDDWGVLFPSPPPPSPWVRPDDDGYEGDELLLKRLTLYFQKSIMTWINTPDCRSCGAPCDKLTSQGVRGPETPEEREGGATRVEVYFCETCQAPTTTFPRYNAPRKLLETRKGRCGEYANLFGVFCRAAGFETRYVTDFTDHVWVEVYSPQRQDWIMADSCEGIINQASMYEAGWGKELNYILGVTPETVVDVTRRYTRKLDFAEFQARRLTICPSEAEGNRVIQQVNATLRASGNWNQSRKDEWDRRLEAEQVLLEEYQKSGQWDQASYTQGRISGSLQWRQARKEAGTNVDEHKDANAGTKNLASFYNESFYPPAMKGLVTITVTPFTSSNGPHGAIVVSGVPCAVGKADEISIVVVDESRFGCILQSRSFASWMAASEFVARIPEERILAISAANVVLKEADASVVRTKLARLGGFELPHSGTTPSLLYIGQVNRDPKWATFAVDDGSPGIHLRLPVPESNGEVKLRTERSTVPCRIACRLPESVMPLKTQMLATEQQKRMAFLSFVQNKTQYVGYTTRANAPVYLLDCTAFPFRKLNGNDKSWNTFHFLPSELVATDDEGIPDQTSTSLVASPKFDIPLDESFFTGLFGPTLLVKNDNFLDTPQNTTSALHNARLVALYFSAHWCPPCRKFTPMLIEMYTHLKEEVLPTHGLEVVFVSSDRDPSSFSQYYGTMPWLAVPYQNGRPMQQAISARYGVRGIPSLVVLDAMSGQVVVSMTESRTQVTRACQGGDDAIADLLVNQWLKRIPPESQAIMETLALSCEEEESSTLDDDNSDNPYLVGPAEVPTPAKAPAVDSAARIKEFFAKLVADGMEPTAAAAKAIEMVAEEQKRPVATIGHQSLEPGALNDGPWLSLTCLPEMDFGLPMEEVVRFNDANMTSHITGAFAGARFLKDGQHVVGLSSIYRGCEGVLSGKNNVPSEKEGMGDGECWQEAELIDVVDEKSDQGCFPYQRVLVFSENGEGMRDIKIARSQKAPTESCEDDFNELTTILEAPKESELIGFHGTISTPLAKIASLGIVCRKISPGKGAPPKVAENQDDSLTNRVAADVMQASPAGKNAVKTVLKTAKKYLENAIKQPWQPKFRSFRLSNKVFDRITSTEGGLRLLQTLGFSMYWTETDYMACIPSALDLDRTLRELDGLLEAYSEE